MALDRLKKKKDLELVLKKGEKIKIGFLFLRFLANNSAKNRFGIIVSKKVAPKATARNKIRRRIRAVLERRKAELKQGFDAVIVALPGTGDKDFAEIEKTMDKLLSSANFKN